MRLTGTTGVLASLIAVCAATPTPAEASVKAFPSTPADGDWHIGCDTNKHCSYYQDSAVASGADAPVLFRRAALSSTTCTECTAETPCSECLGSNFLCYSCEHWECYDEIIGEAICLDVAPELAESIRNSTSTALASSIATSTSTVLATYTATSTSTTVTTSTSTATSTFTLSSSFAEITTTSTSVEVATTIITVLPSVTTSVPTVITITVDPSELPGSTYTVLPQGQGNLARRDGDDAAQTSNTDPLPVRRHAAFKQSQCTPCGPGDCPSCYMDCDDCEHFLCNDMATYLTVCMSVRSQWQPPSLNISAYGSDLYTTVVAMAQASTLTTTATIMVASAPPSPSASTSTSTSTVFAVSPPALSSGPSTVFVFPSVPSISTSTEFAVPQVPSVSTVLEPSFTTVFAVPQVPSVSTVFAVPQATQLTTITLPVPALPSCLPATMRWSRSAKLAQPIQIARFAMSSARSVSN
ncbi:hypothetical protein BDW02DRAFT_416776 [Decorospora gaudefroyi]|uniref:Membrane anchor Opy2 N-terminal domain-containing protein n=1 Tax=Decorospora gaudefroyi TaxID=184978 RepID=A0A6A5K4T1_9PLEO|nr:hypothetical protein BDW02DRAFT_416776 [Decorospora gaudefroyi]